ncbi:hypothetical protein RLOC_00001624 [Lonchura striata]|uniref:Uncharacterized protein n=1 Tax=Lonchura striata TaxID=40157 RepID=A0A218UKV5_9PASE|nr:hypothetical protein RLOC_00001624 [Lonchura striata domestica]
MQRGLSPYLIHQRVINFKLFFCLLRYVFYSLSSGRRACFSTERIEYRRCTQCFHIPAASGCTRSLFTSRCHIRNQSILLLKHSVFLLL